MATITPTRVDPQDNPRIRIYKWASVTENDACTPVQVPLHSDKTVQVEASSYGSSGAITMDGALQSDLTFRGLRNQADTAIVINTSSRQIWTILENVNWIKPVHSAGTGYTLDILLLVRS
jgi:hypothetical protein